jgi:hypothetical protein
MFTDVRSRVLPAARRAAVALLVGAAALPFSPAAAAAKPDTRITKGPSGLVATRSVTFKFAASPAGAHFACKLDRAGWKPCSSPKKYAGLSQGKHTFRVRAVKDGVADPTPATRSFTVDSVRPNTTILGGPSGTTGEPSPSFTFSSNEKGTFQCRLGAGAFAPCTSPFTPASPLSDADYVFRVRARDKAGNVDASPATRAFRVLTPVANDLATAQAAAAYYFPNLYYIDVAPACGDGDLGGVKVDCNVGVPNPPGNQLQVTALRTVSEGGDPNYYGVTMTHAVSPVAPVEVQVSTTPCEVTLASANGSSSTWSVSAVLLFVLDDGAWRIEPQYPSVSGVEAADFTTSIGCITTGFFTTDLIADLYEFVLSGHMGQTAEALCAAPGPAYLGPCDP